MPNTFGSSGGGFPLIDPRCVRENRERFRREEVPELALANSYYMTNGRWPDVGWILLDRASYDKLDTYSYFLRLELDDFINPPVVMNNLSIVQARCVTRGLSSDPNAIYLVQITNNHGMIYNRWFQFPLNAQFNVRAPAYDGQYYSATINSGTPWTWDGMLGRIWGINGFLGPYPGLPHSPLGTPENFIFPGVPIWEAIMQIMSHLGLVMAGKYPDVTIVRGGAADSAHDARQSTYRKYLEDDMEYIETGAARIPGGVVVYFQREYQYYGSEETVRRDSLQWQTIGPTTFPAYEVSVSLPNPAPGTAYLWDSYTVRHDEDGVPLPTDENTAALIAAERAEQYMQNIFRGTHGFMRQTYAGALPFTVGSQVDGVRWYQTNPTKENRCGWRTEVVRGYVWPEVTFSLDNHGVTGPR